MKEVFAAEWDNYIKTQIFCFKAFHELVLKQVSSGVPHYFMRYEDTTQKATEIITELFQFMMNTPSLRDTVLEKRINE